MCCEWIFPHDPVMSASEELATVFEVLPMGEAVVKCFEMDLTSQFENSA